MGLEVRKMQLKFKGGTESSFIQIHPPTQLIISRIRNKFDADTNITRCTQQQFSMTTDINTPVEQE